MAIGSYDEILKRAVHELSRDELNKLAHDLSIEAARKNETKPHSILELRGLCKEVWEGIDPDEYVAEKRNSWDG